MTGVAGVIGTVPLPPRLRLLGSAFGGHTSIRRGSGFDVAGSRPYEPGDHIHAIDWKGSARLSAVRASDEFIVRDKYAEEMPRVVVVCDRRPDMELFPSELPWLHKPDAVAWCTRLIAASAVNQRALVGYLDYGGHNASSAGQPFWRPPSAQSSGWRADLVETIVEYLDSSFDAPADNVELALRFLGIVRGAGLTTGSFVFVISDFLELPPPDALGGAIGRGWDVVPVIVQDPIWEQSFPPLGGLAASFGDVGEKRFLTVRLTERETVELRQKHEERLRRILDEFSRLGLDPVLVSSSDPVDVHAAFLEWAGQRDLHGRRLG